MITLDYVIANDDRHLNNFGLLRDAETLEWLGPAPLYDCDSSLGNGLLTSEFPTMAGKRCKPFKGTFEEQIRLVRDFDVSRLDGYSTPCWMSRGSWTWRGTAWKGIVPLPSHP